MFPPAFLDPTAGERARQIREFPERPRVILDPTDPRNGIAVPEHDRGGVVGRVPTGEPVVDPDRPAA